MSSQNEAGRKTVFLLLLLLVLSSLGRAEAASATAITMSPNPATVDAFIGNDFSLRLDSGDSVTRTLAFTVTGSGGCGPSCPSTAVTMIVFDGATVLSARDSDRGLFSSGNVVRGFVTSRGSIAGLLIDLGAPSAESFSLTLSTVPTTATLYALNLSSLSSFDVNRALSSSVASSTRLTFSLAGASNPVPEPSAVLAFGSGMLVAAYSIRRRAA